MVDADWHAFSQALYKGIEGEDWGGLYDAFTEMSRAVGDQKPQEAQKGKALWKTKAAKDAGEEYYDPEREDSTLVRHETRLALWEEHLKDPIVELDKALKCVEHSCLRVLARVLCERERSPMAGDGFLPSLWKKLIWVVWRYLDSMDSVC